MFSKNIDETLVLLNEQVKALKERAEESFPAPVKLLPYNVPTYFRQTLDKYFVDPDDSFRRPSTKYGVDDCLQAFEKQYKDYLVELEINRQLNVPILAHNQSIRDKIGTIMKAIGVYPTFNTYDFKTVRSKEKTPTRHTSGYVDDLNRVVSITDNYLAIKQGLEKTYSLVKIHADKLKNELGS